MSAQAVIDVARSYLGVTEDPPGSNKTVFGHEYGLDGQPWCVMFLWYCFQHAGERMAFFGGGKTASCSILLRWYREQGLTVPVEDVQAGDIVLLNFHSGKEPEHCGLVVTAMPPYDTIVTIEGNTAPIGYSQANGGMVMERTRYHSQIVAVCCPQYKEETGDDLSAPSGGTSPEGEAKDDITGHWAEDNIRWCMEHGLMSGYPDGSFKPDKPVTRAELATVLRRLADK